MSDTLANYIAEYYRESGARIIGESDDKCTIMPVFIWKHSFAITTNGDNVVSIYMHLEDNRPMRSNPLWVGTSMTKQYGWYNGMSINQSNQLRSVDISSMPSACDPNFFSILDRVIFGALINSTSWRNKEKEINDIREIQRELSEQTGDNSWWPQQDHKRGELERLERLREIQEEVGQRKEDLTKLREAQKELNKLRQIKKGMTWNTPRGRNTSMFSSVTTCR